MKTVYVLMVLFVAALALGCVGQKQQPETTSSTGPQEGGVPPPYPESDPAELGIENDLAEIDSMFNESEMDISFEVNSAFT